MVVPFEEVFMFKPLFRKQPELMKSQLLRQKKRAMVTHGHFYEPLLALERNSIPLIKGLFELI